MTRARRTSSPKTLKKLAAYLVTIAFLITILPVRTLAWGGDGHRITALVAYALLNPRAKKNVNILLQGRTIAQVSTWPDDLKRPWLGFDPDPKCVVPGVAGCNPNYRPETTLWHFVDIPVEGDGHFSKSADYCRSTRQGDCIILAIDDFVVLLKQSTERAFSDYKPEKKRQYHDALGFLVHFLGDLHQPLHCAERNNDGGGNSVQVTWQNGPAQSNLHSVWDGELVMRNIKTMPAAKQNDEGYAAWVVQNLSVAERDYATLKSPTIKQGTPENVIAWAESSHTIARNVAYSKPAQPGITTLDQAYFNAAVPEVQKQLRLGGVRLARILNEIFDKDIQVSALPHPARNISLRPKSRSVSKPRRLHSSTNLSDSTMGRDAGVY